MSPTAAPASPVADLQLRVLQVAGGDTGRADALRAMMWDTYCTAGRPLGTGEAAMWTWWAYGQGSTAQ